MAGPNVLLVEDTETSARATAKLLAQGEITADVTIQVSADAALAHMRSRPVDLIVVDLTLPDHRGLELLASIRSSPDWKGLPVVVLSGMADPAVVQRSFDLGADCFVRKPKRIIELVPAVRAIEHFWVRHSHGALLHQTFFELPLAPTADAVREARATVRRVLDGWGLSSLEDTAELCTSELATNAVIHAGSPVLLMMALLSECVRVEVEDEAPGEVAPGNLLNDTETGRGLALVDMLTTSWGVDQHDGGKTVWFELRRTDLE